MAEAIVREHEVRRAPTVVRTMLADRVYEALQERIIDQQLPAGAKLNVYQLAAELDVSPTPVREALSRLAAERLVVSDPYRGYSVAPPLGGDQVVELWDVRALLEGQAALLGASRVDEGWLAQLSELAQQIEQVEIGGAYRGFRDFHRLEDRFHRMIVEASGNLFLVESYQAIRRYIWRVWLEYVRGLVEARRYHAEHQAIVEAYARRDGPAAATAVAAHMEGGKRRILALLEHDRQEGG